MKGMLQAPAAWDRIATREELSQIVDLLETVPTDRDFGRLQTPGGSLSVAGGETSSDPRGLWLDSSEEDARAHDLDASLESLAELFADRSDLVN